MTNKSIKLYSKNKDSLKRFIQLLDRIDKKWKNLPFAIKHLKKKKKKVTVLKSPHVNKTAQTQFQAVTYGALIKYSSWEIKKNLILLKKIRNHLFPDVKIKIRQDIFIKKTRQRSIDQFLPKKIYYYTNTKNLIGRQNLKKKLLSSSFDNKNKNILLKKTLQFMKVLDHFGKLY